MSTTTRDYISRAVFSREGIDRFLDPNAHNWGTFDATLGYVRQPSIQQNGVDRSFTVRRDGPLGEQNGFDVTIAPGDEASEVGAIEGIVERLGTEGVQRWHSGVVTGIDTMDPSEAPCVVKGQRLAVVE